MNFSWFFLWIQIKSGVFTLASWISGPCLSDLVPPVGPLHHLLSPRECPSLWASHTSPVLFSVPVPMLSPPQRGLPWPNHRTQTKDRWLMMMSEPLFLSCHQHCWIYRENKSSACQRVCFFLYPLWLQHHLHFLKRPGSFGRGVGEMDFSVIWETLVKSFNHFHFVFSSENEDTTRVHHLDNFKD